MTITAAADGSSLSNPGPRGVGLVRGRGHVGRGRLAAGHQQPGLAYRYSASARGNGRDRRRAAHPRRLAVRDQRRVQVATRLEKARLDEGRQETHQEPGADPGDRPRYGRTPRHLRMGQRPRRAPHERARRRPRARVRRGLPGRSHARAGARVWGRCPQVAWVARVARVCGSGARGCCRCVRGRRAARCCGVRREQTCRKASRRGR